MNWKLLGMDDEELELLGMELANEVSRKILRSLREFPKSPNDLSKELNVPLTTIVFHIDRLTKAGLIEPIGKAPGKRGRKTLYALKVPAIVIVPTSSEEKGEFFKSLMEKAVNLKKALAKTLLVSLLIGMVLAVPTLLLGERPHVYPTSPVKESGRTTWIPERVPERPHVTPLLVLLASLLAGVITLLVVLPYSERLP